MVLTKLLKKEGPPRSARQPRRRCGGAGFFPLGRFAGAGDMLATIQQHAFFY
jgi:hypothetical protein